jgi:hypothetical protein
VLIRLLASLHHRSDICWKDNANRNLLDIHIRSSFHTSLGVGCCHEEIPSRSMTHWGAWRGEGGMEGYGSFTGLIDSAIHDCLQVYLIILQSSRSHTIARVPQLKALPGAGVAPRHLPPFTTTGKPLYV